MQLLSLLGAGLFIAPLLPLLGAIYFFYTAYKSSKSGSTQQVMPGKFVDAGNIAITKLPRFWIGVALVVFTIAILILIYSER